VAEALVVAEAIRQGFLLDHRAVMGLVRKVVDRSATDFTLAQLRDTRPTAAVGTVRTRKTINQEQPVLIEFHHALEETALPQGAVLENRIFLKTILLAAFTTLIVGLGLTLLLAREPDTTATQVLHNSFSIGTAIRLTYLYQR
jgi:hypothetical protein